MSGVSQTERASAKVGLFTAALTPDLRPCVLRQTQGEVVPVQHQQTPAKQQPFSPGPDALKAQEWVLYKNCSLKRLSWV